MFNWKVKAVNQIYLDENVGGKGKYFKSRFLQPGLVKYSFGVCVLDKETIDKFIQDFVGCPVIINHKDVTEESAKDDRVGAISRVWYDEADGWYWGEGVIFDDEALGLIDKGFNVSCQYEITEYAENKTNALHNGNPYDKVILNGKPEHLAIVENPRYENAMIAVNALEVDMEAKNEDKWITIHPNGEDEKGKHLLLKDGETPKEAIERTYGDKNKSSEDLRKEFQKYQNEIFEKHKKGILTTKEHEEYLKKSKEFNNLYQKARTKENNKAYREIIKLQNDIKQAINAIKETDMFKSLFNIRRKEMNQEEMKALFMECLSDFKAANEAEKEDDKEEKAAEEKAENECDYKKMYEELKAKVDAEAANKCKNEDEKDTEEDKPEEIKEEVKEEKAENEEEDKKEAKNSIDNQTAEFLAKEADKVNTSTYISQAKAIELGNQLF